MLPFSSLPSLAYLNELYTRAFQADQVPDVLNELAQLLPVAQLTPQIKPIITSSSNNQSSNSGSSTATSGSDCAKLVHLYANMLMHCINRTDDVALQRFVQALAVIQPDVRDHLIQTSNCGGLPAIVANGDANGEEGDEDPVSSNSTLNHRLPPKIIPPELMMPFYSGGPNHPPQQQPLQRHHNSLVGCMSLPNTQRDVSPNSAAMSTLQQQVSPMGTYHHPHHPANQQSALQPPPPLQQSIIGTPVVGPPILGPQRMHPNPFHAQLGRQRTMPEGSTLATLVQNRQLNPNQSPGGVMAPLPTGSGGCVFVMEGSGMRDVPIWLKNLRLHKYTPLFEKMTYEEMINLNEEWLEAHKVTKGATNKIMQHIQKLRERQSQLRHFEKEIMQNPNVDVRAVLDSLHQMMNTPMKRYTPPPTQPSTAEGSAEQAPPAVQQQQLSSTDNMQWILGDDSVPEGDLPGQMTRLIGRLMCYFLIRTAALSEPSLLIHFIKLVDKCAQHEAFTDRHRTLLAQTKQRCSSFVHASQPPRSQWSPAGGGQAGSASPGGMGYRKPRSMQSELRASPSVPASMPGSRSNNAPNGVVGDGGIGYGSNSHPYSLSPTSRNYWLEQQAAVNSSPNSGSNNGGLAENNGNSTGPGSQMPLGTSYSLRAAGPISPLVSGRPPPHSMTSSTPPGGSNNNVATNSALDTFLPFNTPPSTVSPPQQIQGPPGFAHKQFRQAVLGGSGVVGSNSLVNVKTPLGRTQSAPQTPQGGPLLMMSFGSRNQAWLSPSQTPTIPSSTSPTGSSSTTGSGNFGPPGGHVPLSPQSSTTHHHHHQQIIVEAEALASSQLNTLCLQMTDVCLNAPDFSEQDEKFNET